MEIGDKVYGSFRMYGRIVVREGVVVKVTPTGRINVDFGHKQFGTDKPNLQQFKDGYEVGGDKWHRTFLITKDRYDVLLVQQNEQRAVDALVACLKNFSTNSKAEILAQIEQLQKLAGDISDDY